MPTAADLLSALSSQEELAPDPHLVLAGTRRASSRYRRRRAITTVTASLLVTATVAVLGVATVSALDGPAPGEPDYPADNLPELFQPVDDIWYPYAVTIRPGVVAGYELRPESVNVDYQIAYLYPQGSDEVHAYVVIYRPDAAVSVSMGVEHVPGQEYEPPPSMYWEWAPDAEAVVTSHADPPLPRSTLQEIAAGIMFSAPVPVTVPYRLDYLPAGITPNGVTWGPTDWTPRFSRLDLTATTDPLGVPTFELTISDRPGAGDPDADWRPETFAGRPAECARDTDSGRGRCRVQFDDFIASIGFVSSDGFSNRAEAERIIEGLHPATWDDPDTWYPLPEALPLD